MYSELRRVRLSVSVDDALVFRLREMAITYEVALSRLAEEALREYLAARPSGEYVDLLARVPRAPGRRSRLAQRLDAERRTKLTKRAGRPLRLAVSPETVALKRETDEQPDAR